MNDSVELSIVMPCLNEAETLETCILKAKEYLAKGEIEGEIIISDNGSTDGSLQIAADHKVKIVHAQTRGYGAALKTGVQAARGKFIIMGDADDSYDFSDLSLFLNQLRKGADLVVGNRFKGGIRKGAMPFLHRYLGNPVLSFLGRIFFGIKLRDFHCGLRGFSRSAFDSMKLKTTGMEFASEMIVKASIFRMKLSEVPTVLSPDGRTRPPHLRTWRDGWRHLRFLLLFSPKWLFLIPGIVLMVIAALLGVLIFIKPLKIQSLVLDLHTLIYLSFVFLVAIQLIFFHLFVRVFAVTNGIMPETDRYRNTFKYFTLERGLTVGFVILVGGLVMIFRNFYDWGVHHFGALDPEHFIRQVLAATLTCTLGVQLIIYSFVFSVLGIKK